jgi:hypothetical protein
MKRIIVRSKVHQHGFVTSVNNKKVYTKYPSHIWNHFPSSLRQQLADTAAYFFTQHFVFSNKTHITYAFPPPRSTSMFFHDLAFSLQATIGEIPSAHFTAPLLLKKLSNAEFSVKFTGIPEAIHSHKPYSTYSSRVLLPMSFGKDSLLTYAVSREIGLEVIPVFIEEPTCSVQNQKKHVLAKIFTNKFHREISYFKNSLGVLRDKDGLMWGWDTLLTQYTLLYIPFLYALKARYLFWSNEQSTNELVMDEHGYLYNPTFEQSVPWTLHLNNLLREYSSNTTISSIIEPLHELVIMYILHKRYNDIGRFQLSCDSEHTRTKRWCEDCYECARIYLFLVAIGIDPKTVGFTSDMFKISKKDLYYVFPEKLTAKKIVYVYQNYAERLLAFYIAYKNGAKGELINKFRDKLLPYVVKHKKDLIRTYFSLHSTDTIPPALKKKILPIYKEELRNLKRELT